jgi:LysM repeat protein
MTTPCTHRSAVIALVLSLALPAWGQQYLLYSPQPAPAAEKTEKGDGVLVKEIEVHKGDTLYGISRKFSGRGMYYPQILLFNGIKNPNLIYPGDTLRVPLSRTKSGESEQRHSKAESTSNEGRQSGEHLEEKRTSSSREAAPEAAIPSTVTNTTDLPLTDLKKGTGSAKSSLKGKRKPSVLAKKRTNKAQPQAAETAPALSQPVAQQSSTAAPLALTQDSSSAGQKLFEAGVKAYRQDDCRTAIDLLDKYLTDNASSPLAADATLYKAECFLKLSAQ